jgi:hypothetical protein
VIVEQLNLSFSLSLEDFRFGKRQHITIIFGNNNLIKTCPYHELEVARNRRATGAKKAIRTRKNLALEMLHPRTEKQEVQHIQRPVEDRALLSIQVHQVN